MRTGYSVPPLKSMGWQVENVLKPFSISCKCICVSAVGFSFGTCNGEWTMAGSRERPISLQFAVIEQFQRLLFHTAS